MSKNCLFGVEGAAFGQGPLSAAAHKHPPPLGTRGLSRLFVLVVAFVSLLSVGMPVACEPDVVVNLLYLMYNPRFPKTTVDALSAGFEASLAARGTELGGGAKVSVIRPSSYDQPIEELFESALEASEGKLLVVLGPLGNDYVKWSLDRLEDNDLVAIAPMAYSDEFRGWNRHLYFTTVEPDAELLTLIRYSTVALRLSRIGAMYQSDSTFGKESYDFTYKVFSEMGYELCGTFSLEGAGAVEIDESAFDTEWDQFLDTQPLAVFLLGSLNAVTKEFVRRLATDDRTKGVYGLAPSSFQVFLLNTWRDALEEKGDELMPGQLVLTGVNPLANHTRFGVVKRFQKEMEKYLASSDEDYTFEKPPHFLEDDTSGELMMTGWVTGEVVSRALRGAVSLTNRVEFMRSLYDQRRYLIDDFVIGDYGDECNGLAEWQGAMCRCNQGGSVVFLKEVVEGFRLSPVAGGFLTWGASQCSSAVVGLRAPLNGLTVLLTDNEIAHRAGGRFLNGASALLGNGRVGERDRFFLHPLEATGPEVVDSLNDMRDVKVMTALFGVVNKDIMSTEGLTFIDPITTTPRMNRFKRNVIYLSPTLAQEFYVLVQYLSSRPRSDVHVVMRTHDATMIEEVLVATLRTYGVRLSSKVVINEEDELMAYLPRSGDVFVIGLAEAEADVLATHLRMNSDVCVFAVYPDVTLLFEELKAAFGGSPREVTDRLVFATSQPHWAEQNSSSETVRAYHAAVVDESLRTPMSLRGFIASRLMLSVLEPMRKVDAEVLSDRFFAESNVNVDDMRFGPFSDVDCVVNGIALASNCLSNYGATNISVWSFTRALDPTAPLLQDGVTPTLVYVSEKKLSKSQVVGIAIGSTLALVLVGALAAVLFFVFRDARDNELAPREPNDPVTLIFTDIESSTAQWAAFPELMPDAVAAHHSMIRTLAVKYDCYEVKTIGDSFMIACRRPLAAVQLVREMQQCFLHHNWGTTAFDQFYHAFEEQRASEDKEYAPASANLDPEVYRQLWNGLRVRVGVHTGLCDIRYDEVTKGYDYYGQTTNVAARTESVANGGQVLLTHAAYMALSESERAGIHVTSLGAVSLRGTLKPVELLQLNAVPGRTFAALRLDREYFFDECGDATTMSTSDHSSSLTDLSETAQMIASSLQAILSTFKAPQREKLLQPYCDRWRVALPRAESVWDDAYCGEVVRRLAVKVGRVVDHAAGCNDEPTTSTRSTSIILIPNRMAQLDECLIVDQTRLPL